MFIYSDNIGKVDLIDHMGTDLTIVNAARVSFAKRKDELDEKDIKLIKYLIKNKHTCYDNETEIFTSNGWKLFKDLNKDDFIAAVSLDGQSFSFENPAAYYESEYQGKMISVESNSVNFCVTPNHKMYFSQRKSDGWKPYEIEECQNIFHKNIKFKTCAKLSFNKNGTDIDFYKGKLVGFFLGDGFLYSANKVSFRLKKERKIKFLKEILNFLKINYEHTIKKHDIHEIKFSKAYLEELDIDTKLKCRNKKYSIKYLLNQPLLFSQGVYDGLMSSDGYICGNTTRFNSYSDQLLDFFNFLATILGKNTKLSKSKTSYTIKTKRNLTPHINDIRLGKKNKPEYIPYNGKIYCVQSSTGLLLTRRKGRQLISGNSVLEHCQMTFLFKVPLFIRSQHHRHRTWAYNEISRRYTGENLEFYYPNTWRTQSKDNKQASDSEFHNETLDQSLKTHCLNSLDYYNGLVDKGVAREMARMVLPQNLYTEYYGSVNLHNALHFLSLRLHSHSQWEIQQVAKAMKTFMIKLFPETMKIWDNHFNA